MQLRGEPRAAAHDAPGDPGDSIHEDRREVRSPARTSPRAMTLIAPQTEEDQRASDASIPPRSAPARVRDHQQPDERVVRSSRRSSSVSASTTPAQAGPRRRARGGAGAAGDQDAEGQPQGAGAAVAPPTGDSRSPPADEGAHSARSTTRGFIRRAGSFGSRAASERQPGATTRRRRDAAPRELAAVERHALAHPEQAPAGGGAVVGDLDARRRPRRRRSAPSPARHGPASRAPPSASCTSRYAVRSTPAGSARASPATISSTGSPAASARRVERVDVHEARLRRQRQLLVLLAQHPEQPAQLGERLAPGVLDRRERVARAVRVALGHPPPPRSPGRSSPTARAPRRRAARRRSGCAPPAPPPRRARGARSRRAAPSRRARGSGASG